MNEESLFAAAIQKTTGAERDAYLDEVCAGKPELRSRVEALLREHAAQDSFLQQPPPGLGDTIDHVPISERPGMVLGRYKLREQIGEGGMGVVFVAEQQRPVRRKVALKIIKPGLDTRDCIARFEAERQALALMDHPNIAKVLDAGATSGGRPYFVMELVRGIPITAYCDQNRLSVRDRLHLFVQVCFAIQHAHQKGIIHRDVKPSNVLVTLHDGQPVPKVIDFGVAKAINQRLTNRTIYTRFAQVIGTPAYMSPEQAELSGLDIDTRADVYALGVLLYELLTGSTPFDSARFEKAAYDEIRRIIREEEPPKPSTKISTLGQTATVVSAHRQTDPQNLHQQVRGDLDWMVMKALEKDRTRRYDTASSFAADVQRYLDDVPIEARAPTLSYQTRKYIRRNKTFLMITASVLLVLVTGMMGTTSGWLAVKRTNQQLQQLVDEYRNELLDKALFYAMSGNAERTNEAISKAIGADASPEWEDILKGQLALYGGDHGTAVKHLEQAIKLDEDSVASRAMLAVAYSLSGREDDLTDQIVKLEALKPQSPRDFLFLGQALIYWDPGRALETVERATAFHESPLFYAIRAEARAHVAGDRTDLDLARAALADVQGASTLMPENPYVLMIDLFVHLTTMGLLEDQGQSIADLKTRAGQIAMALEQFPSYLIGHTSRVMFYADFGDNRSAAVQACLDATKERESNSINTYCAAVLCELGQWDHAARLMEQFQDNSVGALTAAQLLVVTPQGRNHAAEFYKKVAHIRSRGRDYQFVSVPEIVLRLGGLDERATKECAARLASDEVRSPWHQGLLQFAGRTIDGTELIKRSGNSSFKRCSAHFMVALDYLSTGDLKLAESHFKQCAAVRTGVESHWARVFLTQLQTKDNWWDWINRVVAPTT